MPQYLHATCTCSEKNVSWLSTCMRHGLHAETQKACARKIKHCATIKLARITVLSSVNKTCSENKTLRENKTCEDYLLLGICEESTAATTICFFIS
jgi:hypothetical protein